MYETVKLEFFPGIRKLDPFFAVRGGSAGKRSLITLLIL
jgi:hypothetical protein